MKVFISWSGETSRQAAQAVAESVRDVFTGIEPWLSSENIEAGQKWCDELMSALEDSSFAVVCLTADTLYVPWIMFECGAVSAKFGSPKVVPLLLDCAPKELGDPLKMFQAVAFDRESVRRLFGSINESLDSPLKPVPLNAAFDTVWPKLESAVKTALQQARRAATPHFDIFLSAPMAALKTDARYCRFRAEVMRLVSTLRDRGKLSVFCALEGIEHIRDFDTRGLSAHDDIEALKQSGSFVMIYPQRLPTSAIFEAGYALALGLPCRLFIRKEEDLPYLLQRLPEAFTNVSIMNSHDWETFDDIGRKLLKNSKKWFGQRAVAQLKD